METFHANERSGCLPLLALTGLICGLTLILLCFIRILIPGAFILSFAFCALLAPGHQPKPLGGDVGRAMLLSLMWGAAILAVDLIIAGENDGHRFKPLAAFFISGIPAFWLYYFLTKGRPVKETLIGLVRRFSGNRR